MRERAAHRRVRAERVAPRGADQSHRRRRRVRRRRPAGDRIAVRGIGKRCGHGGTGDPDFRLARSFDDIEHDGSCGKWERLVRKVERRAFRGDELRPGVVDEGEDLGAARLTEGVRESAVDFGSPSAREGDAGVVTRRVHGNGGQCLRRRAVIGKRRVGDADQVLRGVARHSCRPGEREVPARYNGAEDQVVA